MDIIPQRMVFSCATIVHDKDRNKNRGEVEKIILFVNNYLDNKQFGLSA